MQQSMPAHMKQYVGAYMQQQVVAPRMTVTRAMRQTPTQATLQPSVPQASQQNHFNPLGNQFSVTQPAVSPTPESYASTIMPEQIEQLPEQPAMPAPTQPFPDGSPAAPQYPPDPGQPNPPQPQTYDFIVNPEQPSTQRTMPSLPGVSPKTMRAVFIAGGLLVLLILFVFVKGLVSNSPDLTSFISVAQDQQELIHLVTAASQQQGLATANQNFAATAQLSLASSESAIVKYLVANGKKVDPKILGAKISTATDTQLTAAAAAATYDQTFQDIMKTKLGAYTGDLKQTYPLIKGKNGRALLNDDFNQAQLLLGQLNSPAQ